MPLKLFFLIQFFSVKILGLRPPSPWDRQISHQYFNLPFPNTPPNLTARLFVTQLNPNLSLKPSCYLYHYSKALLCHSPSLLAPIIPTTFSQTFSNSKRHPIESWSSTLKVIPKLVPKAVVPITGNYEFPVSPRICTPTFLYPLIAVPSLIRFIQCTHSQQHTRFSLTQIHIKVSFHPLRTLQA